MVSDHGMLPVRGKPLFDLMLAYRQFDIGKMFKHLWYTKIYLFQNSENVYKMAAASYTAVSIEKKECQIFIELDTSTLKDIPLVSLKNTKNNRLPSNVTVWLTWREQQINLGLLIWSTYLSTFTFVNASHPVHCGYLYEIRIISLHSTQFSFLYTAIQVTRYNSQ